MRAGPRLLVGTKALSSFFGIKVELIELLAHAESAFAFRDKLLLFLIGHSVVAEAPLHIGVHNLDPTGCHQACGIAA